MKPVVLVTGGARGIGKAIAAAFSSDHDVAITYHTTSPDAAMQVYAVQADLGDPQSAQQVIDAVIRKFGRLDVLVNNAGAIAMDTDDSALIYAVNVAAPVALLNAALPHLKRGASVVNISSVNAVLPAMGAVFYSASKAALDTWTRGMAKTLGPDGIRVNGVAPGAIERVEQPRPPELVNAFVEMTALGRCGVPEDIAKVVRFLASDAAGFITGETITVSGGYRL
ncbi:putative 3-oxoacyl-(Acyl-carrier-protein) reductase [Sulfitobacter noctilucicola]|uniref:3-oxoacyl-[acyl-carrier protein] reductase n=1 Tax=Sulfitobacter noctilucicola TaxID=1342301 RepID=A0A7W6Q589_9RHOB|nr:SDR family oxidoreductase [Sulfitobacter noctilucicola]KIN64139.1 putative 3-oxoacyl-(Acyl-carrier-protein) reductase [Sulfitobacter noctilucicola]MBB4175493.1 3-oxoacyl-[acyl-carrier protein] reductase [Sulfitobacter noctilucicola]